MGNTHNTLCIPLLNILAWPDTLPHSFPAHTAPAHSIFSSFFCWICNILLLQILTHLIPSTFLSCKLIPVIPLHTFAAHNSQCNTYPTLLHIVFTVHSFPAHTADYYNGAFSSIMYFPITYPLLSSSSHTALSYPVQFPLYIYCPLRHFFSITWYMLNSYTMASLSNFHHNTLNIS